VDDVSLEIKDQEFLVLLGPSGCGKSTILRCIAGLENPDGGTIQIGDSLVNDLPPKDRNVAMVFQSYALYPHMTVSQNIAFPLKIRKFAKDEIQKRTKEAAEILRITHLLDRKPRQLSGGERQRVALGRCIVREPSAFLMDEPLSNLDAALRLHMRAELKRLQKELQTTTIYVTHDQAEAMTMADRIAILNQGRLIQVDNPANTYGHPGTRFVGGFIGSPPMNFIQCSFVEKEGAWFLETGQFEIPIRGNVAAAIRQQSTSEVELGIRPEDISIYERPMEGAVASEVYVVEPLGSEAIVNLKIGDNVIKAKSSADFGGAIGRKVWLSFNASKMAIFDKSGKAFV
jgi:multiple sugar transport system ATP-binding protein